MTSNRLDCCVALRDRDASAFAAGFDALVAERQVQIAKDKKTTLAADIGFVPRSHVYIEGLALLRAGWRLSWLPCTHSC